MVPVAVVPVDDCPTPLTAERTAREHPAKALTGQPLELTGSRVVVEGQLELGASTLAGTALG